MDAPNKRNINKFSKIKVKLKSKESNGQDALFIMTHQEETVFLFHEQKFHSFVYINSTLKYMKQNLREMQ